MFAIFDTDHRRLFERSGVRTARWAGTIIVALSLGACGLDLPNISSPFGGSTSTSEAVKDPEQVPQDAAKNDGESQVPRFTQFTDIPIPANADVDLNNLLVLGTEDGWIGRLALQTDHDMTDMYAFYEREMPRFGWDQITIIRSAISTLTYSRGARIATITLQSRATGGAQIEFTVAPGAEQRGLDRARSPAKPIPDVPRRSSNKTPQTQVGTSG